MTAKVKLVVEAFTTDLYLHDGPTRQWFNVLTGPGEEFPDDAPAAADRILAANHYRRVGEWEPQDADPRLPEWTATVTTDPAD